MDMKGNKKGLYYQEQKEDQGKCVPSAEWDSWSCDKKGNKCPLHFGLYWQDQPSGISGFSDQ